ncbi:hypothetical protein [Vibrio sp. SCSIO 43136]|uniref:hypothetical protein n=1 Tax=Vibrio sp. SCSIO 43136 TaxID=2819101 RepID=UPI002075340D|nr:hypothetical protein [Vibrio sp. SCSIO 43136]USD67416.1 hypothetical protein J4N39_22580 [Vibrio sp. SCSIO 43136]
MDFKLTKLAAGLITAMALAGCNGPTVISESSDPAVDPVETNLVAQILDTLGSIEDGDSKDTGELRIKLEEQASVASIVEGSLTATLLVQADEDTEATGSDIVNSVYVSLYSSGTSSSNMHGDIILTGGVVKYRDSSGSQQNLQVNGENVTYPTGEEIKFQATWDQLTYSFSLDGGVTTYGPFDSRDQTAVTVVAFKLGDNDGESDHELLVDDIVISDQGVEVFSDDFESYSAGDALTVHGYNSNSSQATVYSPSGSSGGGEVVTEDFDSYTSGTQIDAASSSWSVANVDGTNTLAAVSSTFSNSGANSLHIADFDSSTKPFAMRSFTSGAASSGSVSFDVYVPAGNTKVTYINVGTGKNNSDRYFELRINGDDLEYESGSTDTDIAADQITADTWHTIDLAWSGGSFDVTLNGTKVGDGISQSATGLDSANIPTQLTLYTGDNSGNANEAYFDNIKSSLF